MTHDRVDPLVRRRGFYSALWSAGWCRNLSSGSLLMPCVMLGFKFSQPLRSKLL
jgi:hypothetical protein